MIDAASQRDPYTRDLEERLAEATATLDALLSGQIDAVVDQYAKSQTPVLLSKAQDALRASEEQYRQIVEATSDGILRIDCDAVIVFANQRIVEMLGYQPREMLGKSVYTFMSPSARPIAASAFQRERHRSPNLVDATFCHKDRSEITVNISSSPLVDAEGRFIGNLAVIRDVTERNQLQGQLMVSDRMASVGTLAAGVAHEINNPLAAVIANLDFVADNLGRMAWDEAAPPSSERSDGWYREELKAPLDDAREAARRVRSIVRDLKIFSRSELEEPKGPADVKAIMESSLRMAWNEIRHRARLVKHYGVVPHVAANEARLGQVFLNLIVNAAQAMPEGRAAHNEIAVTTRLEGKHVIIEVSDTGSGIPPEIIGRVFDAFFTTKEVGMGTGLGLAICHRIITDMQGELTVKSELGKGTTFRVKVPAVNDEPSEVVEPIRPVLEAPQRGRVLVVDDEMMLLRSVKRALKQHEVITTDSAREALARCEGGERFDVILCDLMMPDMTGMDLHRELLRVAPDQANRMIFLTGGAFTPGARLFLSDPPKEHIEKPFDADNVRAIVQRYLRLP